MSFMDLFRSKKKVNQELFDACCDGNREKVEELLKSRANPNFKNKYGVPCIFICKNLSIIKLLLKHGADINTTNSDGQNALYSYINEKDSTEVVQFLVDKGIDVNCQSKIYCPPLDTCASEKKVELARILIDAGANPDNKFGESGTTPLMRAADAGATEMVRLLLSVGVKVYEKNSIGETALIRASGKDIEKIVDLLIQHGAEVDAETHSGDTAVTVAAIKGQGTKIEVLAKHGADLNHRNGNGLTPLMLAKMHNWTWGVDFLKTKGATGRFEKGPSIAVGMSEERVVEMLGKPDQVDRHLGNYYCSWFHPRFGKYELVISNGMVIEVHSLP
jgi:ankyrin repeat protein